MTNFTLQEALNHRCCHEKTDNHTLRDGGTRITGKDNRLRVERGKADLYICVSANAKLSLKKSDAYLHHPVGRDYDPDGPKQGKPGSAIELDWCAEAPSLELVTVLYPVAAGDRAPRIRIGKGKVIVNGAKYEIPDQNSY